MDKDYFVFDVVPKWVLLIVTIGLLSLSVVSLLQFGIIGIFLEGFKNSATIQIFIDLVISLGLLLVFIFHDAKIKNRNFTLWLIITLAIGSFGPLLYLITRKK
jgi:hypothetical protein